MADATTSQSLKEKQRRLRGGFEENLSLRVHRAISWLQGAERSRQNGDLDAAFICYWIAFNAAYVQRAGLHQQFSERKFFDWYFGQIVALDSQGMVSRAIWHRFSGAIRGLMRNHYVFAPFWHCQHGDTDDSEWRTRFEQQQRSINRALAKQDTVRVLTTLFDRLYVLRNQLMHGGATWNGSVNREQVADGVRILASLVPQFVDLMMDNPDEQWGLVPYPVVAN